MQLIIEHQKKYPHYFKKAHSTLNYKACEIELFNLWVNFQKISQISTVRINEYKNTQLNLIYISQHLYILSNMNI